MKNATSSTRTDTVLARKPDSAATAAAAATPASVRHSGETAVEMFSESLSVSLLAYAIVTRQEAQPSLRNCATTYRYKCLRMKTIAVLVRRRLIKFYYYFLQ